MGSSLSSLYPDPESVIATEPAELAQTILREMWDAGKKQNRNNFSLEVVNGYPQQYHEQIVMAVMEAWAWLEGQRLIAQDAQGYGYFITREGEKLRQGNSADGDAAQTLNPPQGNYSNTHTVESVARMSFDIAQEGKLKAEDSALDALPAENPRTFSPRSETIFTASVSDQPAKTDSLGFEPYVKAIADFLTNERTSPPLTLSIEGEWGSGKSSFMSQLKALLSERGHLTIEFNAWRHDKEDELWAAFALEFIKQISDRQRFWGRWWANFSLRRRRYDLAEGWLDLLRASATWLLVLCAIIGVPILLLFKGLDWITWLTKSISDGSIKGQIVGWIISLGSFFAAAIAIVSLWLKLKNYIGNPVTVDLKKHLKSPDYEERVAFIENFHSDLKHIVSSYVGKRKVYIFIDDLDRCEVPKAADLMQAINLMIANDPQLVFIIGMDREKIAAGLAVKHEKLLPYLSSPSLLNVAEEEQSKSETSIQTAISSDPQAFDRLRGLEYGYRFIEKFIQLPFRVPQPGKPELQRLLDSLDVTANPQSQGRSKRWFQIFARNSKAHSDVLPLLSERTDSIVSALSQTQVTTLPAVTTERRRQMLSLINGATETNTIRNIVLMVAPILDDNPRRIKQFINLFRLKTHIANETGLFDEVEGVPQEEVLTLEQLGKFVALTQKYPRLLTDLETDKELLNKMQYSAKGLELPDLYQRSAAMRFWENDKEFMALLLYGLPEGKSVGPSEYSLAGLKVDKLLLVSPRIPRQATASTLTSLPDDAGVAGKIATDISVGKIPEGVKGVRDSTVTSGVVDISKGNAEEPSTEATSKSEDSLEGINGQEQRDIARKILEALYDTWERHTNISLNTVQEQGGWERNVFRTVVDKLEKQHDLIKNAGTSYSFEMTPTGVIYAEENEIVPKDKAERHEKIRQHILALLADLYDKEGSRAHIHYQKIAEGAPVKNRMEILRDLSLLTDLGDIEAASTSSFRITNKGLRKYRGAGEDLS